MADIKFYKKQVPTIIAYIIIVLEAAIILFVIGSLFQKLQKEFTKEEKIVRQSPGYSAYKNVNTVNNANTNTATDETAGWKTYSDDQYGFSLQYPLTWFLLEGVVEGYPLESMVLKMTRFVFTKDPSVDQDTYAYVVVYNNASGTPLSEWVDKYVVAKSPHRGITNATVADIQGLRFNYVGPEGPTFERFFLPRENYIYEIGITYPTEIASYLKKMLSTFRFTADWKTYTNNAIGYSVKYPKDWSLKETNEPSEIIIGQTAQYLTITNPVTKHSLHLGVRKTGDTKTDIWSRTGIGAGDFKAGDTVIIGGTQVKSSKLVYQSKAVEIFYSPVEHATQPVVIGSYDVSAYFSNMTGDGSDLTSSVDYQTANTILSTLTFAK